jgi:2-polyprenyl-6-methoxyphenol hydroxylase-like FAD-dependent oxidoreductase
MTIDNPLTACRRVSLILRRGTCDRGTESSWPSIIVLGVIVGTAADGKRGHAIIAGASIGGLVIARALSESFEKITLIDRDELPPAPATRRGTPQSRMVHGLLAGGAAALEELFPGLEAELVTAGVPTGDIQSDMHWYLDGRLLKPARSGLIGLAVSRPLLEFAVRSRVSALPGVTVVDRHDVTGLLTTADRTRITGVRIQDRDRPWAQSSMDADLVVDATGRGTRSPGWLRELGYPQADSEEVRVNLNYMTQLFRRESQYLDGRVGTASAAYPGMPRGGFVLAQEGDRFILGLSGWNGDKPPTDRDGMAEFADTLLSPDFAEIIRKATPLGDPVTMRYPASVRRRYEGLGEFPGGYLVVADALCSFNPFYGQGMTVAALEALALSRLLRQGREDIGARFFREAADLLDNPWSLILGSDLRFPDAEGPRTPQIEQSITYMNAYRAAAADDAVLGTALLRVTNMLDTPDRLAAPDMRERVLKNTARVGPGH